MIKLVVIRSTVRGFSWDWAGWGGVGWDGMGWMGVERKVGKWMEWTDGKGEKSKRGEMGYEQVRW